MLSEYPYFHFSGGDSGPVNIRVNAMFIRTYTYLCLVLIMVLLNGNPVRDPRAMLYDALKASEIENKKSNDEVILNVSGNVYIVERSGTDIILVPASVSNSSSYNTQTVAANDAILIVGAGVSADNESVTSVTQPSTDDVTSVSDDRVTVVSDSSSCCTQSAPPSDTTTVDGKYDMLFRVTAYDAPLAARAYESINTGQSKTTNQKSRVSVHLNGGYCYQFVLMKNPTSKGLPYNITDVTPISCPNGVFP
ncbi:uncharacterized protein DEA37_0000485 [Paragonimus westermani]|uniref:Uncharacterized protein n=1 Tax=Paragonimus westermani TaxID=34504 RepID=A0A5J4NAR0_9TREM|nr:uncharacterized protein DEA37_0000485 [Paragonimus westermani]